ncbi:MAG: type II 3-dehydroquinate dehydratase, partial [Methyloceanibacter sp.]
ESWRHASVIAPVAKGTMAGFGIQGYALAIEAMAQFSKTKSKR